MSQKSRDFFQITLQYFIYMLQNLCQFAKKSHKSIKFDKLSFKHLDNKFNTCFKYPNFKFFLISPFSPWEASQGSSHCYFLSTECSSKRIHELSKQLRHDLRCWGQQLSKYHPQCVNKSKGLKSKPIEMNRWIFKKSN